MLERRHARTEVPPCCCAAWGDDQPVTVTDSNGTAQGCQEPRGRSPRALDAPLVGCAADGDGRYPARPVCLASGITRPVKSHPGSVRSDGSWPFPGHRPGQARWRPIESKTARALARRAERARDCIRRSSAPLATLSRQEALYSPPTRYVVPSSVIIRLMPFLFVSCTGCPVSARYGRRRRAGGCCCPLQPH